VHDDRVRAESFGAVAQLYDRARPSYPEALIDALLAGGARRVLDVGSGTGIAAALLAARGCSVLGVEVDARMATVARAKGIDVEVGRFEQWDARGRTFDLVTAAQSWHWVEPHAGAVKVASVLADGGRVGIFWNTGDPDPAVRARIDAVYRELEPGLRERSATSQRRRDRTRAALEALAQSGRFGPVAVSRFAWSRRYDTAAWLAHLASHSDHVTLAPERRERLLAAVGAAIDELGGSFPVAYDTLLVSARRR
jgi:SAM-dependent methyltransferase